MSLPKALRAGPPSPTRRGALPRPPATKGAAGTATVNAAKGGRAGELARGVVVHGDGKVVIPNPATMVVVDRKLYDVGGANDAFLGGAASPDSALLWLQR